MSQRIQAVDTYVAKARPFAQPILTHVRDLMHHAVPEVEEQMKWSRPFFVYRGVILGNVAAFTEHCSLGLWGEEMARTLREAGIDSSEGMGTFGKLTSVEDLPPAAQLEAYIRQAAELIGGGTRTKSIQRVAKPVRKEVSLPVELSIAFQTNRVAAEAFARLSPSCRREYAEWIDGAKRSETRLKRTATAVLWISKGRSLNARYETAGVRSSAPEGQQVSQAR